MKKRIEPFRKTDIDHCIDLAQRRQRLLKEAGEIEEKLRKFGKNAAPRLNYVVSCLVAINEIYKGIDPDKTDIYSVKIDWDKQLITAIDVQTDDWELDLKDLWSDDLVDEVAVEQQQIDQKQQQVQGFLSKISEKSADKFSDEEIKILEKMAS